MHIYGLNKEKEAVIIQKSYHDLNFPLAHLEVMFIVDKHTFQGTFHPIACSHQKDKSKSTCEKNTQRNSFE